MYHWVSLALFAFSFYVISSFVLLPALAEGHSSWVYSVYAFAFVTGVLWLKSFFRVMTENPGFLERKHSQGFERAATAEERGGGEGKSEELPYCATCGLTQPERTFHCPVKNRCIRRYDRYCAWVNNSIGLYTHKFFIMFLFYTAVWSLMVAILLFPQTKVAWKIDAKARTEDQKTELYIGLWALFEAGLHCYFFLNNLTWVAANLTYGDWHRHLGRIREFGTGYINPYDLSTKENLRQVMGHDVINYLNPWSSRIEGEGIVFPKTNVPRWNEEEERQKRLAAFEEKSMALPTLAHDQKPEGSMSS